MLYAGLTLANVVTIRKYYWGKTTVPKLPFPSPYPEGSCPTITSLKEVLASVHMETIEYAANLADEDLEGEIEAGWGGTYPLIDMIWHVMEHEIHHRGELSLILGLLGREGLDA